MASRSDTELLTEHFGYPPVSLLDEIINAINFLAERALHSIEQGLLNAPPASLGFRPPSKHSSSSRARAPPNGTTAQNGGDDGNGNEPWQQDGETEEEASARRHREEVEAGTHQLETLLWASIDKDFDRFEIYVMRNILCLRPVEMAWLRLGHYEGLGFGQDASSLAGAGAAAAATGEGGAGDQLGEGEEKLSVESVNGLRRRLQASQRLNCMLVAERARNAALLGEMRRLVGVVPGQGVKVEPEPTVEGQGGEGVQQKPPFRFLHDKGDLTEGDAETPLTTTTAFSLSQLQALRELSTALRGVMAGLAGPDEQDEEEDGKGRKSWRRERLEYVETATKKHLENVRGLELGKNGEVRDGEWDGGGRSLAAGEVESLERAVGLLGRDKGEQDRMDES
ncbi:Mis12 protein-domain-containing protein [Parachaetomium inaequale]|uniref:Mis12 protein-domain-containing protein n=1 Tax=Parachaetomium inaequale TaxID=2588326 RepID=A0AAN6PIS5_9PEZI|nr:Mis12 protein-domain-containing protein [Parachaetomium inaequale]